MRFQIFVWKRQSQNRSLMFFKAIFGLISDFQKRRLSSDGIIARSLKSPTVSQTSMKLMPTTKGITKLL